MADNDHTTPSKTCMLCEKSFPETTKFFRIKDKSGRLSGYCRLCNKITDKISYDKRRIKILAQKKVYYIDNKQILNIKSNNYAKTKNGKESAKRSRIKHKEKRLQEQKMYYINNKEKSNKNSKIYREEHKEEIRVKKQIKYQKEKSVISQKKREIYLKNKSYYLNRSDKRRTIKLGLPWNFPTAFETFTRAYWKNVCAYCGAESDLWTYIAMDHWIPLANSKCPGTIITNILPACHGKKGNPSGIPCCNQSKCAKDPVIWLIEKLGPRKAKAKLKEIATFFEAAKVFAENQKVA